MIYYVLSNPINLKKAQKKAPNGTLIEQKLV